MVTKTKVVCLLNFADVVVKSDNILPTPTSLEDSETDKPQTCGVKEGMFSGLATVPRTVESDLITPQSLPTVPSSSCISYALYESLSNLLH